MSFDPYSITSNRLNDLRQAAETAWGEDTRHPDYQEHPQPSAGQCFVTSKWLQDKLGGHVGYKRGHYFWVSPDKNYVIDLTGDMTAYEPYKGSNVLQDSDDEPYTLEPELMQHRPGPPIYTKADHPLYRDFRVREYPDHPRAQAFARRANAALEGKIPNRLADAGGPTGFGGDAYPAQEPQAEDDFANRYFHDTLSDLQLSQETPESNEYRWFYGNGQLHVSPIHDHDELRDHSGTPPDHSGPIAVGFVHVTGGNAVWSAESNIALRGLKRVLEDYGKAVGWKWGGLVGGDGQPIDDDFGPKKSYWYRWQDGLQISERPLQYSARIDIEGKTASVHRSPGRDAREALQEWADDFGYRLADYPGGTDMTDRIKTKEWPMQYDKGNPDKGEAQPAFDGEPQGELTCPHCKASIPDFKEFVLHMKQHEPDDGEIPDGHFPTIEDKDAPLPLKLRNVNPTAMPIASYREASRVPDFDLYADLWGYNTDDGHVFYGGYLNGQLVGYGVVCPEENDANVIMVYSAVPRKGVGEAIAHKIKLHWPRIMTGTASPQGETLAKKMGMIETNKGLWRIAQGQEPKDMLEAPLPFVYDIKEDHIVVGHPGQKTSDIMGKFTPGGIVEGYYEPGGKIVVQTTTTMPYSTYHLMQLWYYTHPQLQITGLELETDEGKPKKLAAANVGTYIRTLVAADGAAHTAEQALTNAGGRVYVVGGAVRDALLGEEPKDIDLMVSGLPPEEVQHTLDNLPGRVDLTGKRFGVYRYRTKGQEVEVALPRTDDYGTGGRRGTGSITVNHELPIENDLTRRDFTANSMAVDARTGELIDPHSGADDIKRGVLRTTHPDSFQEDPTRLVRALTASSRFGLSPDERTRKEMAESAHRIAEESPDALKQQIDKLMASPNPAGAIRLAHETGVLRYLFPELEENFDYDQNNPHHNYTLGEHTLQVLDNMAKKTPDPHLRLAALFHDLGKPASAWVDPRTGESHYYAGQVEGQSVGADHEILGANIAEARLRQTYNYPVAGIRKVHNVVQNHMWNAFSTPKGARKFLNKYGESADDLLTFREADTEGKGDVDLSHRTPVATMRNLVEEQRGAGVPTDQTALSLNGNDLIAMGLKPGPAIGRILRNLTNDVVENPALNERSALEQRAQEYINAQPE